MRLRELTSFALGGLWRQKVRTALTLVGVMVGTCALAFSLALGFGLRAFIDTSSRAATTSGGSSSPSPSRRPVRRTSRRKSPQSTGSMSDERRERLREALVDRYVATHNKKAS